MANKRWMKWRVTDVQINDAHGSNAIELDVHHDKGGANYFSGGYTKAGFWMSVTPIKIENGSASMILGNSMGRRFYLLDVPRFNVKKLEQLTAAIKPHTAAIVAALLRADYEAIKNIVTPSTPAPTVTVTRTKKALGTLLREALEAKNLPVVIHSENDGRMTYEIEGVRYTPGDAADQLGVVWQ